MTTVTLAEPTYRLLQQRAAEASRTPDDLANEVLRHELAPEHAHIEVVMMSGGQTAVVKGTRIPVSILVGYVKMGETPQTIIENILPHLTLAQVYDALSYYYDYQTEIDRERLENSEQSAQRRLREQLGEDGYRTISGQSA